MSSKQPVHHCHNCGIPLQNGNICFDNGAFYCTQVCKNAYNTTPKCKHCKKPATTTKIEASGIGTYCGISCFQADNPPLKKCLNCDKPISGKPIKFNDKEVCTSKCFEDARFKMHQANQAEQAQIIGKRIYKQPPVLFEGNTSRVTILAVGRCLGPF